MPLRFLLVAPAAFLGLFFFAGYYFFHRRFHDKKIMMVLPVILFGIPSAITNVIWNVIFASIVFLELPAFKKVDSGKFSPTFSTRISNRCKLGKDDQMTRWFVWAVNKYDPDHFRGWNGSGPNPYI